MFVIFATSMFLLDMFLNVEITGKERVDVRHNTYYRDDVTQMNLKPASSVRNVSYYPPNRGAQRPKSSSVLNSVSRLNKCTESWTKRTEL